MMRLSTLFLIVSLSFSIFVNIVSSIETLYWRERAAELRDGAILADDTVPMTAHDARHLCRKLRTVSREWRFKSNRVLGETFDLADDDTVHMSLQFYVPAMREVRRLRLFDVDRPKGEGPGLCIWPPL